MKKSSLASFNTFLITSLTFSGYYALLSVFVSLGLGSITRKLTVPIRIFICLLIAFHFAFFWIRKKSSEVPALLFYVFSFLYICRIIWELIMGHSNYHLATFNFLLYYLSFALIPFLYFLQMRSNKNYRIIFYAIFLSSLVFAIQSYLLFGQLLGRHFGRISMVSDINAISPLAFSYCASLLVALAIYKLFLEDIDKFLVKVFYLISIIVALVPLFLGSSRGSILAIFCSLAFVVFFKKGFKTTATLSLWGGVGIVVVYFISLQFGSNLFGRFLGIFQDISQHSESAYRLVIWKKSLIQFIHNPIFGNSLESNYTGFYPHNIFIEALITTGVLGFTVLAVMTGITLYRSTLIVKYRNKLGWVPLIFIQALMQHLFSGGLYSAIWLWASMGMIFSIDVDKPIAQNINKEIVALDEN